MLKSIMNIEEVAEYLGFSTKKIYRLVETNEMPASKIGRKYRFIRGTIDSWLRNKDILMKQNWSLRLDLVLGKMRTKITEANIKAADIEQEIKQVRLENRGHN